MLLRKIVYYCESDEKLLERMTHNKEHILEETNIKKIKKLVDSEIDLLDVMKKRYDAKREYKQFCKNTKDKLNSFVKKL